jgi:hypothetical protein
VDLKDFVKDSIVSIVDGIAEAQQIVADKGVRLNPADRSMYSKNGAGLEAADAYTRVDHLEFDVAVTTAATISTEDGIRVLDVDMSNKMEGATNDQRVSRIQFRVPIVYPCHEVSHRHGHGYLKRRY